MKMKTFKQFLNEKVTHSIHLDQIDIDTIKKSLLQNCSKIINAYKNENFLYRGISSENKRYDNDFIMGSSRQDRQPIDINPKDHEKLHKAFLQLGLKATRKNSIFTTSIEDDANIWGEVYIIFPFDNVDFTWFDLSKLKSEYTYYKLKNIISDFNDNEETSIKILSKLINDRLNPHKSNLNDAMKHKKIEMLINGQYYGIKTESILWKKEIKPWLKNQ